MATTILQLSQLISTSATQLVDLCTTQDLKLPELNDNAFTPESEEFRKNPTALQAVNNIVAAAFQLIACVLPPWESTLQVSSSHYKSAALRVAIECHVSEILREAGDQGLHANDIAAKARIDGPKLARLLRLLANRHIFREIKADVFTNNRISSSLDSGKPYAQILADPGAKYDGTSGATAYAEFMCDEGQKGSSYILETLKDPTMAQSAEPQHAPFLRTMGYDKGLYDWYTETGQAYRLRRFGNSMKFWAADQFLEFLDWDQLPNDALVVDVAGGIGSLARRISNAYPKLNFVVQDIPAVIEDAKHYWNKEDPEAIRSGRVKLQVHDFFTSQPISNASVFVLKNALHNWSDRYALKILTHLRNAAASDTILLILGDIAVPPTMDSTTGFEFEVRNLSGLNPPGILSTGYTAVNDATWMIDAALMVLVNAQQHTVYDIDRLLKNTGWKIARVVLSGGFVDGLQAKPI